MDALQVISVAEKALNMLQIVKPMLGDNQEIVDVATDVVGRALGGVKFGATGYATLVNELNGVIEDLEAIKARGGVTGDDFRAEIMAIKARGYELDQIKVRLTGS